MNLDKLLKGMKRILTPSFVGTLYYLWKFGAKVSPRSEVDVTSRIKFGRGCVVGSFTKIKVNDGVLIMGRRCGIANGCFVTAGAGNTLIGDNFICGPNVNIVCGHYNHTEKNKHLEDQGMHSKGITIGDNVWIGAGSTVTDGAVIGNNTIIVANSLVNRRYPDDVILQGAPAKVIFRR